MNTLKAETMKNEILKFDNWETLPAERKVELVKIQVHSCMRTADTVSLSERKESRLEQEALYLMIHETLLFYGTDNPEMSRSVTEMFIQEYGLVALQDFALFLRKVNTGRYGELYGKMSGGWLMSKFRNFFDSVNYNYTRKKEQEDFNRKQEHGCRDTGNYYNDIKPEILE